MTVFTGFLVFACVWWMVLFLVLPFGIRRADEVGEEIVPGTEPGAPVNPRMGRRFLITTAIATVITAAIVTVVSLDLF